MKTRPQLSIPMPSTAQLRRQLAQLSREGMLAIALLVVAAGVGALLMYPAQLQRAEASNTLARLQAKAAQPEQQTRPSTPAEQLVEFYQFFPSQNTTPQWLDKIYKAARAHGIQLEQGNYATSQEKRARLLRYQLTLPVKGSYVQLRKFVGTVLAAVPIASLDHISFERQKIGDQLIDAKIKLTLYLDQQT